MGLQLELCVQSEFSEGMVSGPRPAQGSKRKEKKYKLKPAIIPLLSLLHQTLPGTNSAPPQENLNHPFF